ncbi:hypothetical protein [Actinophytocola sp.]
MRDVFIRYLTERQAAMDHVRSWLPVTAMGRRLGEAQPMADTVSA